MKKTLAALTAMVLSTSPVAAKHRHHGRKMGSQGSAGLGGNGTTTSSSSDPTMKAGAQRSPTGGAPIK